LELLLSPSRSIPPPAGPTGAARLHDPALGPGRLALTQATLAAGLIDEPRAAVIAAESSALVDDHAAPWKTGSSPVKS
jgi:hypothetical protein